MSKPPSADEMRRLVFIRLLFQQAVDQSRLPEPMNATAILTLHDAVEMFLLVSAEHVGATPNKKLDFGGYWPEITGAPEGPETLPGKIAMGRLNTARVAFKHQGLEPGEGVIARSLGEARVFLEDSVPLIFGLDFDGIDMANLIANEEARVLLVSADQAEASGDRVEALALLVDVWEKLVSPHHREWYSPSPLSIGPRLSMRPNRGQIARALRGEPRAGTSGHDIGRVADQLDGVTSIAVAAQAALRLIVLGLDPNDYRRFDRITPRVDYMINGDRHVNIDDEQPRSREDYEYCRQFVITAGLKIAQIESEAGPAPSRARGWVAVPSAEDGGQDDQQDEQP